MTSDPFNAISNLEGEELMELKQLTQGYSEEKLIKFVDQYKTKRKDPQTGMILGIVPFVIHVHGIQRFYYGNIALGILYLLTGGLCLVGTIIDLVNNKKLALGANREIMQECANMSTGV